MSHHGTYNGSFNNNNNNSYNNLWNNPDLQEQYVTPLVDYNSNNNNPTLDYSLHRSYDDSQFSNSDAVTNVNDFLMSPPTGDTNINIHINSGEIIKYPNVSSIYHQPNSKTLKEATGIVGEDRMRKVANIMNRFSLPQGFDYVIPNNNLCYLYAFGVLLYNPSLNIYRYRCCCSMDCLQSLQMICVSMNKYNSYVTSKVSHHLSVSHGIRSKNSERREDNKKQSIEKNHKTKAAVAKCINPVIKGEAKERLTIHR